MDAAAGRLAVVVFALLGGYARNRAIRTIKRQLARDALRLAEYRRARSPCAPRAPATRL